MSGLLVVAALVVVFVLVLVAQRPWAASWAEDEQAEGEGL